MKKLTANDRKVKQIADMGTALAETRADIAAARVVKESAAAHVKRLKKIAAKSSK